MSEICNKRVPGRIDAKSVLRNFPQPAFPEIGFMVEKLPSMDRIERELIA